MTPHGDTATNASLPWVARVLFVFALILVFIVLGTTTARALDIGEVVDDTADAIDDVAAPIEVAAGVVSEPDAADGADPDPERAEDTAADPASSDATAPSGVVDKVTETLEVIETVKVAESVAAPVEKVVEETTQTIAQPLEDGVAETAVEATELVGGVESTANALLETAGSGLTETLDEVVTTVSPALEDVVVPELPGDLPAEPTGSAEEPDPVGSPRARTPSDSRLVTEPDWARSGTSEIELTPAQTSTPDPAIPEAFAGDVRAKPPDPGPMHPYSEPPAPTASTSLGNTIGFTLTAASPQGSGPVLVFLAAALLLMGHITPRLTEWLRLRPLIWRDDGLALAIERPG